MYFAPLLTLAWAAVLFVATCTFSLEAVLYQHVVSFNVNLSPNLSDLLITSDIDLSNENYLLQKIGHFLGFSVLFILLFSWIRKYRTSLVFCGFYAFLTEILQLFFKRDGRIVDFGVDMAGILLAFLICKCLVSLRNLIKHSI